MRGGMTALAIGLGLVLAAPAGAQLLGGGTQQATSFFSGVNPRQVTFTPINTSNALKQYNGQIIRTPSAAKTFSLTNVFHGFSGLSWPPRIGQSQVPTATKK